MADYKDYVEAEYEAIEKNACPLTSKTSISIIRIRTCWSSGITAKLL